MMRRKSIFDIRPANPEDAESLFDIMQAVWPQQTFDLSVLTRRLAKPDHVTLVAVDPDKTVVGFVDGFQTTSQEGQVRWEIDLLAVHPAKHGQGIGRQLVDANTDQGRLYETVIARALTAVDNTPVHRVFKKCGYVTDGQVYSLLITTGGAAKNDSLPSSAHYVYVDTLNYRGIWLEGEISQAALKAAQALCLENRRDVAGALIPSDSQEMITAAQSLNYEVVGQYIWQRYDF